MTEHVKIRNTTQRAYTFPLRAIGGGKTERRFGGVGCAIAASAVLEVPHWYLDLVLDSKGKGYEASILRLFELGALVNADLPPRREPIDELEVRARDAEARADEATRRVAEHEIRLGAAEREVTRLDKELTKASAAATRVAELERELAKARAAEERVVTLERELATLRAKGKDEKPKDEKPADKAKDEKPKS